MSAPPSVSVIVPVHNAGDYLPPLLDALAAQTLAGIELVFIDDGSDDSSPGHLDAFAAHHPGAVVAHQACAGVSRARNRGIALARGEYLAFADADDLPEPAQYASLLALARRHDLDVAVCNASKFGGPQRGGEQPFYRRPKPAGVVSGEQWLTACHADHEFLHNVFLVMVRREFLIRHRLFFAPEIVHEDIIWTTHLLLAAERVAYTDARLYRYRLSAGSITRADSPQALLRRVRGYAAVVTHLLDEASARRGVVAKALREHALEEAVNMLGLLSRIPGGRERWAASRALSDTGVPGRLWREGRGVKLYRRLLRAKWWAARGDDVRT